jgi:hypothetical protein
MHDPFAEAHKRLMKSLKTMTVAEFRESLVQAGIITKSGSLTPPYLAMLRDDYVSMGPKIVRSKVAKPARRG